MVVDASALIPVSPFGVSERAMTAAPTIELTWWPVVIAGFACLVICIALAVLLPAARGTRRLRPLAHVDRLTSLPEFARAARLRYLSLLATMGMLVVLFGAAVVAGARPVDVRTAQTGQPEEIMLCVGQPVTDPATATLLSYFARRTTTDPGTQRIGLTSSTRRVVPLTRDYQYAAARFGEYAGAKDAQAESFDPQVPYVDYARTVDDVLALCLTGFPSTETATSHRRSLIYLGPSTFRAADDPGLFTGAQVQDLAARAGVRMNLIAVTDPTTSSRAADAALSAVADNSGGRFFRQPPSGLGGGPDQLTAHLDAILADPPPAMVSDGGLFNRRPGETPTIPLAVALVAGAVLSVSLVVLRR
jgi:hypothetical protein